MPNESSVAAGELLRRQTAQGAWGYHVGSQPSIEATCLALLAVGRENQCAAQRGIEFLLRVQNPDGSWPAFAGEDSEGCWTTAPALIALRTLNAGSVAAARAATWLTRFKGREGHWFWRWKFRFFDTKVRFDPEKFGWPWIAHTVSWVIPTAFALIALKQANPRSTPVPVSMRVQRGIEMLCDRMCSGGGWNAGNSVVFGVPLEPYIDATAIALLALTDERNRRDVAISLRWLSGAASSCSSPYGLAWAILALAAYQAPTTEPRGRLEEAIGGSCNRLDTLTLASAYMALQAGTTAPVFCTRT